MGGVDGSYSSNDTYFTQVVRYGSYTDLIPGAEILPYIMRVWAISFDMGIYIALKAL